MFKIDPHDGSKMYLEFVPVDENEHVRIVHPRNLHRNLILQPDLVDLLQKMIVKHQNRKKNNSLSAVFTWYFSSSRKRGLPRLSPWNCFCSGKFFNLLTQITIFCTHLLKKTVNNGMIFSPIYMHITFNIQILPALREQFPTLSS